MESIAKIQEKLEQDLEVLLRRLGKIQAHRRQVNGPLDADWQEQAQSLENDEVLTGLDAANRQEIEMIRGALTRIEKGTYGICGRCGDQIPERRLMALPFAATCVQCASR